MTGFEQKLLRVVIENWLYHEDLTVVMDASTELRNRFKLRFPRPAWAGAKDERTNTTRTVIDRQL